MFNVTLVHLSPDLRTASERASPSSLGGISAGELLELLERFRALDPVQNAEAEPQVAIVSPAGKHFVRTEHGKLFLYEARDSSIPYRELTAAGILEVLAAPVQPGGASTPAVPESAPPPRSPARRRALAFALLAGCVLLNAYTFLIATRHPAVNGRPLVQLITDASELNAQRLATTGRYATGNTPGDRRIEIRADGRVQLARVTASGARILGEDTYRIGRSGSGAVCLVTPRHGVIEIRNIDTIVYYNDVYRRQP